MGRYTGPKEKLSRREGVNLFLKGERSASDKSAFKRRPYPPGQNGKRPIKLSDYGIHLREKQRVKRTYGVREKQFKRLFQRVKNAENRGEALLQLLERRLDNVIYRAGWAVSRPSARQIVSHGHILINDRKVNIPSYVVKEGEVITLKKRLWTLDVMNVPWIEVNGDVCIIRSYPTRKMIDPGIKEYLIVEYYSK